MRTFAQLQEMDRAWHDAANAFQRLGPLDRADAFKMFHDAQARYAAAKEGTI